MHRSMKTYRSLLSHWNIRPDLFEVCFYWDSVSPGWRCGVMYPLQITVQPVYRSAVCLPGCVEMSAAALLRPAPPLTKANPITISDWWQPRGRTVQTGTAGWESGGRSTLPPLNKYPSVMAAQYCAPGFNYPQVFLSVLASYPVNCFYIAYHETVE